jgi:hypothetical protein
VNASQIEIALEDGRAWRRERDRHGRSLEEGVCAWPLVRAEHPPGSLANGNYRHGRFTCEAIEMRRQLAAWIREMNQLAKGVI